MKQYSKKLFSLVVLCGTASSMLHAASNATTNNNNNNNNNRVLPFLQWRSQGRDEARKLYGTTSYAVYQPDQEGLYGTFNATVQYDQSFRGKYITQALFGPAIVNNNISATSTTTGTTTTTTNNNCNNDCDNNNNDAIVISGLNAALPTGVTTRAATDLMAENFLLPRDFKSVITFAPKVQDVLVDLNLYVGFDRWVNGLYFRLYGPIVWNRATLKPEENIIAKGTATTFVTPVATPAVVDNLGGGYTEGFFDPNSAVPTQSLFNSALQFFGGCQFPVVPNATLPPKDKPVTVQPLMFGKFSNCNMTPSTNSCDDDCNSFRRHKTGFAELRGEFGYNYIQEKYRFLINLQAAAPTGSKVKAEYLLPAQVGNGHHWELGVGLGGAWRMWCNEDMERSFNFIVEADITHLFKAKQQRTFDLKCKPLSRYMLAEQLLPNTTLSPSSKLTGASDGGAQFSVFDPTTTPVTPAGVYAPVANFSTRDVKVSFGVQADLVAMFNYTCRGFSWDLGYNFWALSSSKTSLSDDCDDTCGVVPFPTNFALKGDASIAGYNTDANVAIGLGATESAATIFTGTNASAGATAALTNPKVDAAVPATFGPYTNNAGTVFPAGTALYVSPGTPGTSPAINTSSKPVFISINDLDIAGAEQRGLSHKVFTHLSYTWRDCCDRWMPYIGAGFSAEFGSHNSNDNDCNTTTTPATCDTCPGSLSFALSKWAVEIKGGVSFH